VWNNLDEQTADSTRQTAEKAVASNL